MPINLKHWLRDVRGNRPQETYVDSAEVPSEPDGPYRARMEEAPQEFVVEGIDVSERESVKGELQVIYSIRCPCGHEWQSLQFQRMNVCPICNRAVLVAVPTLPAG